MSNGHGGRGINIHAASYARMLDLHVVETLSRSEDEREAATEHTRSMEQFADEWGEDGPLWLGWAIHHAFLAGVTWARRKG